MRALGDRVGSLWCHMTHPAPMWPVNGYYICPTCLRAHPVPWEHAPAQARRHAKATLRASNRAQAVGDSPRVLAAAASQ